MTGALLSLALFAAPASAGVAVSTLTMQAAVKTSKGAPVFATVEALRLSPDGKPAAHLRGVLRIENEGARAESGVVIRYAFRARLRRIGSEGEGLWALPFILDQRHVPQIRRGRDIEIPLPINRVAVVTYLKRLRAAGFWPDALRLEAMLEPRAGTESLAGRGVEKTILVEWRK